MTDTFRRRPLIVEAAQWHKNGDHPNDYDNDLIDPVTHHVIAGWEQRAARWEGQVVRYFRPPHVKGNEGHDDECGFTWHAHGFLDTGGFGRRVCPGDWIVRDPITGELSPVRPNVFEQSYEPVL